MRETEKRPKPLQALLFLGELLIIAATAICTQFLQRQCWQNSKKRVRLIQPGCDESM